MLGGGMRQLGVLAAAGLIALHDMSKRLEEDHKVATFLAEGISKIPVLKVKANNTNFVFFEVLENSKLTAKEISEKLKEKDILVNPLDSTNFRLVTHCWITQDKAQVFLDALKALLN